MLDTCLILDICLRLKPFQKENQQHAEITSDIVNSLKNNTNEKLTEKILLAASIRKFLG